MEYYITYKYQRTTQHKKWKKENTVHQKRLIKIILRTALHRTEPRNYRHTAADKEISLSNDNEQSNKIPVIVNGFTAFSDTSQVPTTEQINTKENDSDTELRQ